MSEHTPEHDPHSRFEDEGIPDLQDGTPQQQWAVDPQEASLPADHPVAVDEYGTTEDEQLRGEPLTDRLAREVPEEKPEFGAEGPIGRPEAAPGGDRDSSALTEEGGLGVGSDLDTRRRQDTDVEPEWPAQPEEPSGRVWDEPRRSGRLVAPDEGAHGDTESDEVAEEVGPDSGGYTAEESAMRVEPE
ncbi:DUF5709 domain-containing protein [Thermostaphylospora chromogena]|uniref:DUF5709 domain-containing protein n=1 Tax=Thermostaphylospora chromogena TaxID=35622 RepID=A0A1H1D8J9_9ACTN|nr:DUF5709 domain-containing protein [Thermostaphylospora chromogena]SDQ72861.1 hypothetical protein SAMN04489764_1879 [Thermostaphylospora chromogena]